MERKEMYRSVKSLHLEDEIKLTFGKNFTQVSNQDLEKFLNKINASMNQVYQIKGTKNTKDTKFDKLIDILKKKHLLLDSEIKEIYS